MFRAAGAQRRVWHTSIFMRMVANREMLDGGSRHETCQLGPPYGARYVITHLRASMRTVICSLRSFQVGTTQQVSRHTRTAHCREPKSKHCCG
jgi:hypothetical protein